MHDIRKIRENPEVFLEGLRKRNITLDLDPLLSMDSTLRDSITKVQKLQNRKNEIATEIPIAKKKGISVDGLIKEGEEVKRAISLENSSIVALESEIKSYLDNIPNTLSADVPEGKDENDNLELYRNGSIRNFDFTPRHHFEIGENLGMMDFEQAAVISGARFVVLKGKLAKLERALINFMLDTHTLENGYLEVSPPQMVKSSSVYSVGQLPKFEEDLFKVNTGHYMISTAEVSLTNLVSDMIIPEEELPLRFTAHTQCYRSEAGSAGRDTRGMIRLHQFSKVEMVSITRPEDSEKEHLRMRGIAEDLLQRLGLPYRVVHLCGGDTGFSSKSTYDIEVWLPSQGCYREISSCSNCGDFQARRMKARYKEFRGAKNALVHTLNGSGLPIGRTIVAILENFQNEDGSVSIPQVLVPYMNGQTTLSRVSL